MRSKAKRRVPRLRSERSVRKFWARAESSDYVDWRQARRVVFPHLRPSTRTISLRLPEALLADLKILANKQDVPYQSLLKIFLAERIRQEFGRLKKVG